MEDIGFIGDNKIFINQSLCPYYSVPWLESKAVLNMAKISRIMEQQK